jgi:prepilin peptidase CpaA
MHSFAWWPTLIVVAIATVTDLRSRRIPNWLVFPFLLLGFVASIWMHGWRGLGQSAEGMALGLLVFGVLFALGGMGAGDVKLFAAIGAWIGPHQLFIALILVSLAGGVFVLAWAVLGGFMGDLLQGTSDLALKWKKQKEAPAEPMDSTQSEVLKPEKARRPIIQRKMPYAPAIAIGTLLSFFAR